MRTALVTICIGESNLNRYNAFFSESHELYAKKCGYDCFVVTNYLGKTRSERLIPLNKCLLCDRFKNYDYLLYVDPDVMINFDLAPPMESCWDRTNRKIGLVTESQPHSAARELVSFHNKRFLHPKYYYTFVEEEAEPQIREVLHTGVLWLQPRYHAKLLRRIYYKYEEQTHLYDSCTEQTCVGYELHKSNMVTTMSSKWNALWTLNNLYFNKLTKEPISLRKFYEVNYFIHMENLMINPFKIQKKLE